MITVKLILFFLLVAASLSIAASVRSLMHFNRLAPRIVRLLECVMNLLTDELLSRREKMLAKPEPYFKWPATVIADDSGVSCIQKERDRQALKKGYTREHDDVHVNGELRRAAAAYILPWSPVAEEYWPFESDAYTPTGAARGDGAIQDLVRAGALIAAEIDRLRRIEYRKQRKENA